MSSFPFLTDYDPAGGLGGSIDPLGAMRTYLGLVDLILPGVTTVTTRSRYLSMLCAAFANAEKHREFPAGPSGVAARRHAVEPYERLWALACATAKGNGSATAARDLRGITFAEAALKEYREREAAATPDFRMLKSQARTGGVATYWVTLVSGDLVTEDGVLTADGHLLARQFPEPEVDDAARLADPAAARRVSIDLDALEQWGRTAHLGAAGAKERRLVIDVLRSKDRRDRIAAALERYAADTPLPDSWGVGELRRLAGYLGGDDVATRLGLPVAIEATVRVERFHEAVLTVFDTLRWWGTMRADQPVAELVSEGEFRDAVDVARGQASKFVEFPARCEERIRKHMTEFASFARELLAASDAQNFLDALLRRHRRVQDGKIDGGAPKREWVSYGEGGRVLRPTPRYQLDQRPRPAKGRALTHPYRLEQFAGMLAENRALPAPLPRVGNA